LLSSSSLCRPNLALKACVMALYGPELVARIQKQQRSRKGERGGAHSAGYEVLSKLEEETWHYVAVRGNANANGSGSGSGSGNNTVQVRRNIVLDAEDQRMQLALAIYRKPTRNPQIPGGGGDDNNDGDTTNSNSNGSFSVEVCMLTMEEDEAVDSGFPTLVESPEDEWLLCSGSNGNGRFGSSHSATLDVQARDERGNLSPLARIAADACHGRFEFVWRDDRTGGNGGGSDSDRSSSSSSIRALFFEHSETGTQLEIDLAQLQNRAGGSTLLPPGAVAGAAAAAARRAAGPKSRGRFDSYSDEDENEHDPRIYARYDRSDDEDDSEHLDAFEEDGFVVGDDDDDEDDDDDACCLCNDGGELMICDGGDRNPGCGKMFHASCVQRSVIPEGDWICSSCAAKGGFVSDANADTDGNRESNLRGHEFPVTPDAADANAKGDDNDDDDDDDDDNVSDVQGAFSSDDEKPAAGGTETSKADEDVSEAEGAFSSDEEKPAVEDDAMGIATRKCDSPPQQEAPPEDPDDGDDTPVVKPSGKGKGNDKTSNNKTTKRRLILDDSDSD